MALRRKILTLTDAAGAPIARDGTTKIALPATGGLYVDSAPDTARTSDIVVYFDDDADPVRLVPGRAIDARFTSFRLEHAAAHVGNLVLYSYEKGEGVYDIPFSKAGADWWGSSRHALALRFTENPAAAPTQLQRLLGDNVGPVAGAVAGGSGGPSLTMYRERVCSWYQSNVGGSTRQGQSWIVGGGPLYVTDRDPLPDAACLRWRGLFAWGAPAGAGGLPNPAGFFLSPMVNTGNGTPMNGNQGLGFYRLDRQLYWYNRPVWNQPALAPIAIAWPAGVNPDGWVELEHRITLATSRAAAVYEGILNGTTVIRRRWGVDPMTDWTQNAGSLLWGCTIGNGSDGRQPDLYCGDLVHTLGPVP